MNKQIKNMTPAQLQAAKDDIVYFAEQWYFRTGELHQLIPWQMKALASMQHQRHVLFSNTLGIGKQFCQELYKDWCKFVEDNKPYTFLHLVLDGHWFKEIKTGAKDEEYRLATDYYRSRFEVRGNYGVFKDYTHIVLHNAYTNDVIVYPIISIRKDCDSKPEWGAKEGVEYYITKFDKR